MLSHPTTTDGAALGLLVWLLEITAVAVGASGIGGASVLAALRDDLAWWGLVYALVGGATGVLLHTRVGRAGPLLVWLALWCIADPGIVPGAVYLGLLVVAAGVWLGWLRLGARRVVVPPVFIGALAGVWLWPAAAPSVTGTPGAGPDVLLIVVDTLRADRVGGDGRDTTPQIDTLAAGGLRFTGARAPSSWTLPSHASLFTGLSPAEHGAHAGNPRLSDDPQTLAEAFDARGYRTVGLSANAWVSGGTGLDRGFQDFGFLGDDGIASQLLLALVARRPQDLGGAALTRRALSALEAADEAGEPVFLFVNYLEAHEPLGTLPLPERDVFGPVDPTRGRTWMRDMPLGWCTCAEASTAGSGDDALTCDDGLYRAGPARIEATTRAYDAGVAYVDGQIGQLVASIRARGRLRDTWIVVTSDHGEHLGEEGRLGHMVWLDDALLDIPLVIHGPGVVPGSIDTAPFDLTELGPWLLARVDGKPPPPRSLRATSEVHPHAASTVRQWSTLFGCDFTPAATARRVVVQDARSVQRDGDRIRTVDAGAERDPTPAEATWVSAPFATEGSAVPRDTRRALEALGYVE